MLPEAATGSGESVLAIARLATAVIVVDSVSVLSPGSLSASGAPTVAALLTVPPSAGAVTSIVIGGAAPTASAGRVHVTVWPALPQVQPVPAALTYATPAGSVSVTVTLVAGSGPPFATASV